jgi:photosystem II stability/assembly factor-like uncharacterized protein
MNVMNDTIYALAHAPIGSRDVVLVGTASGLYATETGQSPRKLYRSLASKHELVTTAIAAHASVLLAGVPGGVLRSSDGGDTWTFVRLSSPTPVITALALRYDGLALAGTLEDGLFCSCDDGLTWSAGNYGLLDPTVLSLVLSETKEAYAGTSSGLAVSRNGGRSWRSLPLPIERPAVLSMAVGNNGLLLIGDESSGVWRSGDYGEHWTAVSSEAWDAPVNQIVLSANGNVSFAACGARLMVSRDDGSTWTLEHVFDDPIAALALTKLGGVSLSLIVALSNRLIEYPVTPTLPEV